MQTWQKCFSLKPFLLSVTFFVIVYDESAAVGAFVVVIIIMK